MGARPEIIGMAGCTGACIGRRGIGNILVILLVTVLAAHVTVVVTGIVTASRVAKTDRSPAIGGMTGVAVV